MNSLRVLIVLSDPWELGEALNWEPLKGELLRREAGGHGGRALIKLEKIITYRGSSCRFVVASPRHQGKEITYLQRRETVSCAFTGISDSQAALGGAPETLGWRGGIAFIGDIRVIDV